MKRIIDMLFKGDVPIGIAAGTLNLPLSRVLLDRRRDGRERPVIPIFSGVRRPVELESNWTVGLDLTSILVLGHVDLLKTTIGALGHVKVAHDAMATCMQRGPPSGFTNRRRCGRLGRYGACSIRNRIKVLKMRSSRTQQR